MSENSLSIYVSTGTVKIPFFRLIGVINALPGNLRRRIFYQGFLDGNALACEHSDLLMPEEHKDKVRSAAVMVCHAGVGTIYDGLTLRVRTIAIPRLADFGENYNNHQVEICKELIHHPLPNVYPLLDMDRLGEDIEMVLSIPIDTRGTFDTLKKLKQSLAQDIRALVR